MTRSEKWSSALARLAGMASLVILLVTTIAADAQTLSVLHEFTGGSDGSGPYSTLVMDHTGNLYGVATYGGQRGCGSYLGVGAGGGEDGARPTSALVFDGGGNLYGTTEYGGGCGGIGCGTVFQLTPSGSAWNANILYNFGGDYGSPFGGVIFDPAGNLYGAFIEPNNGVFELRFSNGSWIFTSLHVDDNGELPGFYSPLVRDAAGNLYGTSEVGGDLGCSADYPYGCGYVYKLTPFGGVVVDANGNIYGTAAAGGTNYCTYQGCGTVWEITP